MLLGSETASGRWLQYEIEQAWKRGKGIVGIYINKLKNSKGEQDSKGRNPFKQFCIDKIFNYIGLNEEPVDANEVNLATVTIDNIYKIMQNFWKLYDIISDEEKKAIVSYLIKEVQVYPYDEAESKLQSNRF